MHQQTAIHSLTYLNDAEHYFRRLSHLSGCTWLDTGKQRVDEVQHTSRFDILSAEPIKTLENPSRDELKQNLASISSTAHKFDQSLPFCGGLIGYLGYEANHANFSINTDAEIITSHWQVYDWALIQDHVKQTCHVIFLSCCTESKRKRLLNMLTSEPAGEFAGEFSSTPFAPTIAKQQYQAAFKRIQEYIAAGDVYQVNFAQHFKAKFSGSAHAAYTYLRDTLSGPFGAFYDAGGKHQVLSFSPEQFISIQNGLAQTRPIKGTAARETNSLKDELAAKTLEQSQKNRAENLMIVDLLRNDFSKNCQPHTVKVPDLFALESYKNVHHLVSTVTGQLKDNVESIDFLYDCFPGGSITGAPKKRAMEIIDELEVENRKIYCGSMIQLSANGNVNSSIAIRTLLVENQQINCWGGGGIVADSNDEEEYRESIQKVQTLMSALSDASESKA